MRGKYKRFERKDTIKWVKRGISNVIRGISNVKKGSIGVNIGLRGDKKKVKCEENTSHRYDRKDTTEKHVGKPRQNNVHIQCDYKLACPTF